MNGRVGISPRWALTAAVCAIAVFHAGGALLAWRPSTALLLACPDTLTHHIARPLASSLRVALPLKELFR